jgi:hypothetical protein
MSRTNRNTIKYFIMTYILIYLNQIELTHFLYAP